ncbi:MAG: AlkZ-related protein [Anaerolineae bacterium]
METLSISLAEIRDRREHNYRRTPQRRIGTVEEARHFVGKVGFCHLWPIKGIETPNLFHAIAGRDRPVPRTHHDPDLSRSWSWKDAALGQRWWYYGKLLRRRATFVSLDQLPFFYAASENFGDLMDYQVEYEDGLLSLEARDIYEALLEHGPLDTIRLRREARLSADSAKYRFDRALAELQVGLKVLPIGVAETGAWHYAFIYEILQRHFPDVPEQARTIDRSEAQRALVRQYLDNVVAAERSMVRKVFHVMRWLPSELEEAIEALIQEEVLREGDVAGAPGPLLVSVAAWAS